MLIMAEKFYRYFSISFSLVFFLYIFFLPFYYVLKDHGVTA